MEFNFDSILKVAKEISPSDYWSDLMTKAYENPKSLTTKEIFEAGRFVERMTGYTIREDYGSDYTMNIVRFKQYLQKEL